MKTTAVVLLLCASLAANLLLWRRVNALALRLPAPVAAKSYPLGEMMGYMQRYADKLWFAEGAGNWALAKFYRDEIAETAEDIAAAHVVDEGVPVSQQVGELLPPVLAKLDHAIGAKDAALLSAGYHEMIETCNTCHAATKHAFIQMAVPAGASSHWNQRFTPP